MARLGIQHWSMGIHFGVIAFAFGQSHFAEVYLRDDGNDSNLICRMLRYVGVYCFSVVDLGYDLLLVGFTCEGHHQEG